MHRLWQGNERWRPHEGGACHPPRTTLKISRKAVRALWGKRAVSTDLKNQLAPKVAGFAQLVRGRGFAEPIASHFQGTDGTLRNQRHDALEMLPITSDAGPQSNDVAAVRLWCLCSRGADDRVSRPYFGDPAFESQ
jgi:hypothetical protein